MRAIDLALGAACAAVLAFAAKAVTIAAAGGLGESRLEDPLFFAGGLLSVVAVVSGAVALTEGHSTGRRIATAVAVLVVVAAVGGGLAALIESLQPADAGWVWGELNLWIMAVLVAGTLLWWRGRASSTDPAAIPHR